MYGAQVSGEDLTPVTITLTEDMRAATVYNPGTPGIFSKPIIDVYVYVLDLLKIQVLLELRIE